MTNRGLLRNSLEWCEREAKLLLGWFNRNSKRRVDGDIDLTHEYAGLFGIFWIRLSAGWQPQIRSLDLNMTNSILTLEQSMQSEKIGMISGK